MSLSAVESLLLLACFADLVRDVLGDLVLRVEKDFLKCSSTTFKISPF